MQPARLSEIIQELDNPILKVKLSKEPTTMGPGYISGKAVEITEAKEKINKYAEELELAISSSESILGDYKEQFDVRTDLILTGLLPEDTEGMDATSRKALAKQRAEKGWVDEQRASALAQGQQLPTGFSLRTEIHKLETWVKQLRVVLKIVDNRRHDLTRLDSTLRLQVTSLQVEAGLFGRRVSGTPERGPERESTHTPRDDSIPEGIESGLEGTESFNNLLGDSSGETRATSPPAG